MATVAHHRFAPDTMPARLDGSGQSGTCRLAPAPRVRTTPWRAHAALVLAYTYRFGLTVPGGQASCRVQIYEGGGQTVAIGTQWQDKFGGTALTENAARVATQVAAWHHPQPDDQFIWVEHFAFPRGPDPQGRWETFAFVTFQRGAAGERDQPTWWPTDRAAVEAVLNQALGA